MSRPTYLTIDLCALQHNYARVQEYAKHQSIIAMVKANAYGHGLERIACAMPAAQAFGVASIDEGIRLRAAGVSQDIVLMEGVFFPDELFEAARYHFTLVIHHLPHIEMLEQMDTSHSFPVWLKINTGMHRLGIAAEEVSFFYQRLLSIPQVKKPIGLMTHFAEADDLNSDATLHQLSLFTSVTAGLSGPRSIANSAGIIAHPATHADWVRPGLMLYGASPFNHISAPHYQLQPVMTLQSQLIAINHVKCGGKVGYGGTWTAHYDMRVGIVGVGYGDGYPQFAENDTPVLVNGVECSLVGRVSMDMLSVNLSACPEAKLGDQVILWGKGLPVERIAFHCRTTAWEILTRMTQRPRLLVKDK